MGKAMAARNGYKAEQSSDLYITDGDQIDWMYGTQRIFSFTWELYPPETSTVWGDHYPPDENIATQTARNRSALLYFISAAGCPYGAIGQDAAVLRPVLRRHRDRPRLDRQPRWHRHGARAARFARGDPEPTTCNGLRMQPTATASGRYAFDHGRSAGPSLNSYDLDGRTTIRSVPIALPATPGAASASATSSPTVPTAPRTRFGRLRRGRPASGPSSGPWSASSHHGRGGWQTASAALTAVGRQTIRIVIMATDGGPDSLVEALSTTSGGASRRPGPLSRGELADRIGTLDRRQGPQPRRPGSAGQPGRAMRCGTLDSIDSADRTRWATRPRAPAAALAVFLAVDAGSRLRRADRPERRGQPPADDDVRGLPRRRRALRHRLPVRRRRWRLRLDHAAARASRRASRRAATGRSSASSARPNPLLPRRRRAAAPRRRPAPRS